MRLVPRSQETLFSLREQAQGLMARLGIINYGGEHSSVIAGDCFHLLRAEFEFSVI